MAHWAQSFGARLKWDSHLKGDGERCHDGDAEGQDLIDFFKWTQNCARVVCVLHCRVRNKHTSFIHFHSHSLLIDRKWQNASWTTLYVHSISLLIHVVQMFILRYITMRPLRTSSLQVHPSLQLPPPHWERRVGTVCPWPSVTGQLPSHAFWSDSLAGLVLRKSCSFCIRQKNFCSHKWRCNWEYVNKRLERRHILQELTHSPVAMTSF